MRKKLLTVIILGVLACFAGCGEKKTSDSLPTSAIEPTAVLTEAPVHTEPTAMPEPTATSTPKPTATPEPTATNTPKPTATPEPIATSTPKPTATPEPTATSTPKPTATPEPTATSTPKPTATPEPTATSTPKPTATPEPTATSTPKPTATPEPTATSTPKPTATPEPTATSTPSPTETPKHTHSYSSKVTKKATCTETGVKTFVCDCGDSYTEDIAKVDHKESEWIVTKEASCNTEGSKHKICTVCEMELDTQAVRSDGTHSYTWDTNGDTRTQTCSGCGDTGITEYQVADGIWGYFDDKSASELWDYVNGQRNATETVEVDPEGNPVALINVSSLISDSSLTDKARSRAIEAATNFSHGENADECLAWGYGSAFEAFGGWYRSSTHIGAITDPEYIYGGIACFYYDSDDTGTNLTPVYALEMGREKADVSYHTHSYTWDTNGDTRTQTCSGCGDTGITEYQVADGIWGYYDDVNAGELWYWINAQRNATETVEVDPEGNPVALINVSSLISDGSLTDKARNRAIEAAIHFDHGSNTDECLAWGYSSGVAAYEAWCYSSTHARAITDPEYIYGGVSFFWFDSDGSGENLTPIAVLEMSR